MALFASAKKSWLADCPKSLTERIGPFWLIQHDPVVRVIGCRFRGRSGLFVRSFVFPAPKTLLADWLLSPVCAGFALRPRDVSTPARARSTDFVDDDRA